MAGFDHYATEAMRQWQVPGMSVAVLRGDSVLLARGYGVRTIGDSAPVDAQTLFAVGSATKAFTAAALAMLADQSKFSFDGRVTDYLPGFEMSDPWVTREIRVRDLLLHRSGLSQGDLAWYGTSRSRPELVEAMRHLVPTAGLRARFQYLNLGYIAAGEVVRQVSGRSWDDFVAARIFAPLGMDQSNTSVRTLASLANVATPHASLAGVVTAIPWRNADNGAAAGAINSNAVDMAKWLRFWINGGVTTGKRLLSEAMVREAIAPQFIVDDPAIRSRLSADVAYGFGWFVATYRGRRWVVHGGNIDGMSAMVSFMPDERLGVVILSNMHQTDLKSAMTANLYDRLLGVSPLRDHAAEQLNAAKASAAKRQALAVDPIRVAGTKPSLPLSAYAGVYRNAFLGTATVTVAVGGQLRIRYDGNPSAVGDLEHWHFDSFVANLLDPMIGKVPVTFSLDSNGHVASMTFLLSDSFAWAKAL